MANVDSQESVGRYLTDDSYFSRLKNIVKPKAFYPPTNLRLSVFRIDGLQADEIWNIGQTMVVELMTTPRVLYGIAKIKVSTIQKQNLFVEPDNNPPRHANIIGWPQEKFRQMSIALELASEAVPLFK